MINRIVLVAAAALAFSAPAFAQSRLQSNQQTGDVTVPNEVYEFQAGEGTPGAVPATPAAGMSTDGADGVQLGALPASPRVTASGYVAPRAATLD